MVLILVPPMFYKS